MTTRVSVSQLHAGARSLPFDADAEAALIGACLLNPALLMTLDLAPRDFYIERYALVYRAMREIAQAGRRVDYVTLLAQLDARGEMEKAGGSSSISAVISHTPTAAHAEEYAWLIKQHAARRALIALAGQIAHDAYNLRSDLDAARAEWLAQLVATFTTQGHAEAIATVADELSAEIEARAADPQEIYGLATGFLDFDQITKGLHRGEVFLLAGQPGMGKSLFAAQAAFQMAQAGTSGAYYALEMKGTAILRRQLAGQARITTARLRGGAVRDDEWQRLNDTLAELSALPLYLSDATHWNSGSLRADVARLKAQSDIAFVVVDHVSLLKDMADDPNERDKRMSQALHDIAKDFDCALLAIHTMNKTGIRNGSSPSLADSAGSVRWIYDADVVAFLTEHLPQHGEAKRDNLRTLTFAKYREDSPDRYLHLVQTFMTDDQGRLRGLPRFESYAEE